MPEFITVKQAAEIFPFSEASIRSHIQNSTKNNFDKVITRVGAKVLLNKEVFENWIENGGNI